MSTTHIGAAIVGCGTIGRTHVAAASAFEEIEIVALVDEIEQRALDFADALETQGKPRPKTYTALADALADPAVELVALGTPSGLHIEQGLAALAADRHVIIEKPLDASLVRAQEIQTAALEAAGRGIVASVISQHRFDESTRIVAEAIADGRFGRVTSAIATSPRWRSQAYYDSGDWRGTWAMDGGGALMNQGVHTLDVLLALMGRPVEIYARTGLLAHERVEVEDTAVATIEFSSGALAVMHASTAANPGLTSRVQIMGSAGSAIIDSDELVYFHVDTDGEAGATGLHEGGNQAAEVLGAPPADPVVRDAISHPAGHVRQYADVLRAIREGTEPGVRVADAAIALATIRAVYISATLRSPVLFDDVVAGRYDDLTVSVPADH